MKMEEAKKMTDEQLGDRVAGICEWTYDKKTNQMVFVKDGDIVAYDWPSLDAMHEAEMSLSDHDADAYCCRLLDLVGRSWCRNVIRSTVRQRMEVFVTMEGA